MKITGFEKIALELEEFADDLEDIANELDDAVDRGVRETALDVERTAKRRAPVETGDLRGDIQAIRIGTKKFSVGTIKEYGPDVEYGTKPHPITPDTADALHFYWEKEGVYVTTQLVNHPGTEPQPFLRPAINIHRSDLVENIREEIRKVVASNR